MTTDQRRTLAILFIIAAVIAILAIGIAWLLVSIGLATWLAIVVAVVVTAALGLFMILQLA